MVGYDGYKTRMNPAVGEHRKERKKDCSCKQPIDCSCKQQQNNKEQNFGKCKFHLGMITNFKYSEFQH